MSRELEEQPIDHESKRWRVPIIDVRDDERRVRRERPCEPYRCACGRFHLTTIEEANDAE